MQFPRFWTTTTADSRGSDSDKTVDESSRTLHQQQQRHLPECAKPVKPVASSAQPDAFSLPTPISPKRRRPSFVDAGVAAASADPASNLAAYPPAKRARSERAQNGGLPSPTSASASAASFASASSSAAASVTSEDATMLPSASLTRARDIEAAKDVIQFQFGLEILERHNELRLIEQELAKCQIALEQLRRCHLIPYPVECPTPAQMLEISSGKGPALQREPGKPVPKWAPPFGVVEGPYARHYAKWLIPDPMFDGIQLEVAEAGRARGGVAVEGRTTRSSTSELGGRSRSARSSAGQRLHSLSSGYPQPKDKNSPCIVRRSDGVTVKLICIDCHRWDFSSTQGFINHCRIAHRRDFKSHEEAAIHCGHPIEVDETGAIVGDKSKPASTAPAPTNSSGLVHPLARAEPLSDHQAYQALLSRIKASLEMFEQGKLPNVKSVPGVSASSQRASTSSCGGKASSSKPKHFVGSSQVPYLSQLMQKKGMTGNLSEQVAEAKAPIELDMYSAGEEESEADQPTPTASAPAADHPATATRMPARSNSAAPSTGPEHPPKKNHTAPSAAPAPIEEEPAEEAAASTPEVNPDTPMYDNDEDDMAAMDMSPNTMTSNNAPSLVSDDGEYDDSSDEGSAESDASDEEAALNDDEDVSDIAEISIDDDGDARVQTRTMTRRRPRKESTSAAAVTKLKKDEGKHVTFVAPTPPVRPAKRARRKKT
ncbi:uncharacterized protein CTHT_0045910 [Thermochaetoides thermophila DSM 1495]|uniref:AHC1-like C2H2 zinc-finger domain-containing protein n=1 Tax=Chaetomium thermophilum (strain DSM 1495 / CBS 144.50 / IMI 039719) TaxID=759272 RepID=G0S9H5_CHATD|nr:hypothetical protein CTHT_0045910 [Thermochaetoides thermophila DSM 1495]EGS20086.1 hypothetical protein CTHT_0045910 [Thermochaetoides thermophila DSM 1495]